MWKAKPKRPGLVAVVTVGLGVAACAPMSLQEEIDLGDDLAAEINRQLPLIEDRAANRYFNDLGQRIARSADRREPIRYRFY